MQKWLKIRPEFLSTLRKFCILLYCQASHTKVNKRNSTKLCQPVESIYRWQFDVEKLGSSLSKKIGVEKL